MSQKRRNHFSQFKAKVALAAFKGDKILAELADEYAFMPIKSASGNSSY